MSVAEVALEKILEEVATWKTEESPGLTAKGKRWKCNCCRFSTPHLAPALDHVRENGEPFQHICFEESPDVDGKKRAAPRRRIVRLHGRVAVQAKARKK